MVESKRKEEVTVEEKRRGASEERGETGSAWQQASPPPPVTNAPIRATTSASRGLNYFLIRSFQASLTGPCIMPQRSLRMLNAEHAPSTASPLAPSSSTSASSCCSSTSASPEHCTPRGTAGQRLRGIFDADSWLVPRSIGVWLRWILLVEIFCRCRYKVYL